jgi:hypothetical protein
VPKKRLFGRGNAPKHNADDNRLLFGGVFGTGIFSVLKFVQNFFAFGGLRGGLDKT